MNSAKDLCHYPQFPVSPSIINRQPLLQEKSQLRDQRRNVHQKVILCRKKELIHRHISTVQILKCKSFRIQKFLKNLATLRVFKTQF